MFKFVIFAVTILTFVNGQQDPYEVCVGYDDEMKVGFGQETSCTGYFYCEGEVGYEEDCVTIVGDGYEFNYETSECDFEENVGCAAAGGDYVDPEPELPIDPPVTLPPIIQPTPSPTQPPIVDPSVPDITCPTNRPGEILFFPSSNCTEYFICANGLRMRMACMEGFTWNQEETQCDYPIYSKCSVSCKDYKHRRPKPINFLSFQSNIVDDGMNVRCTRTGFYSTAYPRDCTKFVFCSAGIPITQNCPIGYAWQLDRCVDRKFASCPDLRQLRLIG